MDLLSSLIAIEEGWKESVKPQIERREYFSALNEINNLDLALSSSLKSILQYHSGASLIARVQMIKKQLERERVCERTINEFEVYLRQTKLAIETENSY